MILRNMILRFKYFRLQRRRGVKMSLASVIGLILAIILFLGVVPMIVNGAENAERAATSCAGWKSEIADMVQMDLC